MSTPVLQLADVVVRAAGRPILDVPHFAVAAGETVAVVGPNGAGKSTLLHVAALLLGPDQGGISILGDHATARNATALRHRVSVVFQDPLLFDVNALTNAAAGARFQGHGRAEAEHRGAEWLARFGIGHLAERRARSLSGGEAARVALARAFATEPALLLLDEPFSALDAPTRTLLLPTLRARLRETGKAAVLVTHDLEEAFAFADRVVLMDGGQIAASGSAASLLARPPSRRVAELLGIENILPARVVRIDGEIATLTICPGGPPVRLCVDPNGGLAPGQDVVFILPAGAAQVLSQDQEAPKAWNRISGRASGTTTLRAGTRLMIETPAPFVVLAPWAPDDRHWDSGETVTIAFAPQAGHAIPC